MTRYRKKPVEVEACRWPYDAPPDWLRKAARDGDVWTRNRGELLTDRTVLCIRTLEGVMQAEQGDYIIRGVKGELYPCKPDIFDATYEQVKE